MAATATWQEDNGAATGSPLKGSVRTDAPHVNWKAIDNVVTPYTNSSIIAGQNSYAKYQFIKFTGSFTQISAGRFAHTAGSLGPGLNLVGKVTSIYETPSRSALSGATNMNATTPVSSGTPVNFSTTGPEGSASSSISGPGYTQYMVTQLQTTAAAAAGDIPTQTFTFQWNEN